jgi:hypothetical protein
MVFSPRSFKAILDAEQGPSDPSRYYVLMGVPGATANAAAAFASILKLGKSAQLGIKCQNAVLPGKQLDTSPHFMYGTDAPMPHGISYTPFSLSFLATNSMKERNYFDNWMNLVNNPTTNHWNFYDNYQADIWVLKLPPTIGQGLDGNLEGVAGGFTSAAGIFDLVSEVAVNALSGENPLDAGADAGLGALGLYFVQIEQCYPTSLQATNLSYSNGNSTIQITVEFGYRRWRSNLAAFQNLDLGFNLF